MCGINGAHFCNFYLLTSFCVKHHANKSCPELGEKLHATLTLALDIGEWSAYTEDTLTHDLLII
jgi:hypothetical protein